MQHSEIKKIRKRYKPQEVKILFIGESPPKNGTFFYSHNSILFYAIFDAFKNRFGKSIPNGPKFLEEYFQKKGCYLIDIFDENGKKLEDYKGDKNGVINELRTKIQQLNPKTIIGVLSNKKFKNIVKKSVANSNINLPSEKIKFLPFPTGKYWGKFTNELEKILKNL